MTEAPTQIPAPAWARTLQRLTTYLSQDAFGGPRPWRLSTLINLQKGGTFLSVLGPYWLAPVLVITPVLGPRPELQPWLIGLAITIHTFGLALMMSADAQKHAALALRPGLITTGLYSRMRHPNYLGEMLLYAAYALLARHWAAWAVLAVIWGFLFLPNMLVREERLSRHPGWAAYKARTGLLFPRLRLSPSPRTRP